MKRLVILGLLGLSGPLEFPPVLAARSSARWAHALGEDVAELQIEIDAPYLTVNMVGANIDSGEFVMTSESAGLAPLLSPVISGRVVRYIDLNSQRRIGLEIRAPH